MITPAWCRVMAAYNAEMNRRLYAAADAMTDADRRAERGAFWGSLHGTLSHLLWGDRMWMSRIAAWPRPPVGMSGSATMIEAWDALKAARIDADAKIKSWAATVTDDALSGDLTWFSGAANRELTRPMSAILMHVFNHQTHHRGQAHCLITQAGQRVEDTDLAFILPPSIFEAAHA